MLKGTLTMIQLRRDPIGLHYFCRDTGLNILMDEVQSPSSAWSVAPRHVSIALGNACDLKCSYCYAPKNTRRIPSESVIRWAEELDALDCFGLGFGGGEPTLYSNLTNICREITKRTSLSVSMTTHGHHFDGPLSGALAGNVHMIRVSMDGMDEVYERNRGRPFTHLKSRLPLIRDTARFGINYLINDDTAIDLTRAAEFAFGEGAYEMLLLPEVTKSGQLALSPKALDYLENWICENHLNFRLAISHIATNHVNAPWLPITDREHLDRELMHIDANGILHKDAFTRFGVRISDFPSLEIAINNLRGNVAHLNT